MLFDLEQRKPEAERDYDNFDPNDEVLVRAFVIPELLDALRHGRFDTSQGMSKTENILVFALNMHLHAEAANFTDLVFEELATIYETLSAKRTRNWWQHIPDEYKEENRSTLEKSERALTEQLNEWRMQRAGSRAE